MSATNPPNVNPPQEPAAGGLALSASDIERLLNDDTPDVRIDVLRRVAKGHGERQYSLRELALAEQILRVLVKDTEIVVREALAAALKDNPSIPRDIVFALVRDRDSVALPLLEHSSVLTDADLIEVIQSAQVSRMAAIARRERVSEMIATALVETRSAEVVAQLMKNTGATIVPQIYQTVLHDHAGNPDVMQAVAGRPELPLTVVEKVISLVSDTLGDMLRSRYHLSSTTVAAETEKTREIATLKLAEDAQVSRQDVEKLVEQLQAFGRLTPSIILTSLCRGNLYFFEASLARLSHIPIRNAQILIHDKGGLGFKALYAKTGLPDKFLAACKLLLEVVADMQRNGQKGPGGAYANTLVQTMLARASGQTIDNLAYIIALIRHGA